VPASRIVGEAHVRSGMDWSSAQCCS
jgi:hypothetical protein